MRYLRYLFLSIFTLLALISKATHIRAGEVIAKRVSGLTYQFTFIGYRDVEGVPFGQGVFDFGDGELYGDDPGETIPWGQIEDLGNGVEKWQFTLTHTYAGGANYLVSYKEDFRNAEIQNIAGSISTSFYVETLVVIDPLIVNSTPFFTVPPIDQGVVGAIFEHNPGAFDPDGDSLSYFFTTPKQDEGLEVNGYQSLIDPSFYDVFNEGNSMRDGPPELRINPVTGTLIWDAPGGATIPDMENREFNVAFVVEEWRRVNGELIRLGFVTRDMQIIIWNYENDPPELEVPEDTCVIAGEIVTGVITGTDPDGDPVKIEAFGGPFELSPSPTVDPDPGQFQGPPSVLNFEWQTSCGQVRLAPYEVQFKATDDPNIPDVPNAPGQVNFETWRITVVGPPPTGLVADTKPGRRIELNWDPYSCSNADSMQVWRRVGAFDIDPTCNPGIPENSGYELIETLDISETSYLDTNSPLGLAPGSKYCYRLVASFPDPAGGLSIASAEACDSLVIDVPIITTVDVKETSETNGEIEVRWTPPYEINQAAFPPTYTYEVLRKEGQGFGGSFTSVRGPSTDTTFSDTGLNTMDKSYSYRIVLYDNTNQAVDTSQQASSVWLSPAPLVGGIRLNWEANVPWSNNVQQFPYHYIYRDNVDAREIFGLQLIDSVDVTGEGFSYLDDGRFNGIDLDEEIEYCYYITTQGSYDNDLLPEPLINSSQIICAQPNDTIPPCPPISITFNASLTCEQQLESIPCGITDQFANEFTWQMDGAAECDDDIQFYRIYFSRSGDEGTFTLLDQTNQMGYIHGGLSSLAGCYMITAVDRSGNESQLSEVICNDNCPRYVLPNVITPNGDDKNDVFRPLKDADNCNRFVESVVFKVFNRAGAEVFEHDSKDTEKTIFINWNGTNKSGKELPAGVYYYSAEVRFTRLNPEDEVEVINGWVQIIR
ncbi:gliding motility-associated C-terminal domain-containing protein [Ekhidna lutea]|uniref:Gliding motility-associated C-terminal domain-containing protein n=1 Tax=Ekhidna lutea TaxID=447679 RepID=A0A239L1V0_EKHLU|nr:gliding motility-associated C-terminal domain-containing protein [Ekhidna lutea]SNT24587.1 gliding motility-associated C-terminal domain-containing protein [Ekhidna lutea]